MEQHNIKSMASGCRLIILLFAIFFAFGAFGLRYIQKANHKNAWRLANEGVTSIATITEKTTLTSHSSSKNNYNKTSGITTYILKYSFPLVKNDSLWYGDDDVSEDEYNSVEIGDQFDVDYWKKNPDIATILNDPYAAGARLAKNISSFLFILATLMLAILIIQPIRRARSE